uniref:separase n=1 Tax=Naja naja TaxID=35670 RepID=A0A8C7E3L5_NAJNA
ASTQTTVWRRLGLPWSFKSLQALADMAYHGYVSARLQYVPLYLERLLYHLLRGAATNGPSDTCLGFADLLYAELLRHQPPQVPVDDYTSIVKSTFSVLWKTTDAVAKMGKMPAEFKLALSTQLQAVRFLMLLEHNSPALLLHEPPFITSIVALHASAASVSFETRCSPLKKEEACFLNEQLFHHLVAAILQKNGVSDPLPFQDCLCIFELMVIRVRYLCKTGCFRQSEEVIQQSKGFLRKSNNESHCLKLTLDILFAGVELNKALLVAKNPVGPFFSQAAEALNYSVGAPEPLLKVLAESGQLLVTPLYEYAKKDKQTFFDLDDIKLDMLFFKFFWLKFMLQLSLVKLLYHYFQLYTTVVYDSFQMLPVREIQELPWSNEILNSKFPAWESKAGFFTFGENTFSVGGVSLCHPECLSFSFQLNSCFKLQVENYRKLGLLEECLQTVVLWLVSHHSKITEQMAEPVCSWVKVKMDANKNGADNLRLKTLKEGLEEYHLDDEVLVKVLLEELKAYKAVRVDTGQERFNVICDLLDICSEGSQWVHERAFILVELAQVLCYHDYSEQTECSALDSIHEALQLLEYVPKTLQNEEQLQDDKAQALLWLYICTVEDKMHEGQKDTEVLQSFETNDLTYEDKSHDDKFLYLGIAFNLCADSVQSRCLDDAFALWKQLLSKGRIPAVRSIEQTAASLHIMAALYRVMGKPLEAIESFFLITALSGALKDFVGKTSALCQIVKLLLQLECPSYAKVSMKCGFFIIFIYEQIEEGLNLLVEILQNPVLQRSSKVWYLLRASALQLTAAYLILPSSTLPLTLRQKLSVQGWKTPETALSDAHRVYRSILLNFLLITSDASTKESIEHPFIDHGDNLVQKWQVLADMFVCSERFVSLLSKTEIVSEAKAFCLETLKISMKVQSIRWCARFLVLKSKLELQRNNLDLCGSDLEQALFLLESGTEGKGEVRIKPKKGGPKGKKLESLHLESTEEEQSFLKEACLEFIDTVPVQKTLTTSPVLRPKLKKQPSFLRHSDKCCCLLCSDVILSTICLHWLTISVDGELTFGNKEEGLHLLEAILQRCTTVAQRITQKVACVSQQEGRNRPGKKLWQFLEKGLTFLSSKGPQLLELEYCRAQLLLARAVTLGIATEETFNTVSLKSRTKKHPGPVSKSKPKRTRGTKTRPPPTESFCTPAQKSLPASKKNLSLSARSIITHKAPFVVFEESSPKLNTELPKAPRVTRRMKSRIKVINLRGGVTILTNLNITTFGFSLTVRFCFSSLTCNVTDILSMDSVYDSLQAAFHSIAHYPLGALYSHLCQLMALCIGNRDPIATAYLVSESVSITLRHQKMTMIHKKQLEALTLQEGKADSQLQHLLELQNVFEFSCPNSAGLETKKFREGLQEIPPGVTVCIMTLVSTQPETTGDILLLTRLEKDATPVNIQIQTLHAKVSLSAALSEFEAILQKQKEISNFTQKEDWWTGRIALDKRMMALMDSLETHVLSCWKIALLPACENDSLVEEASHLLTQLRECGCEKIDLGLLKVILSGSHLLTPQLVEHLVWGLHPGQPERALNLLQETVGKLKSYTGKAPSGHLVLVLDKHLQKLPWENIPCLSNQSITRLPSLHFLLSYSLTKKYQEETILNHGVNSSSTFYVLNPHKNLPGTEKMFREWFQGEPGWTGVVGEVPSTDQVPLALEERDLYIYAGHGAGARFVDSILKMDCRAVAFLFGCSSAALAVQGNLEGNGAILKFIMAGCPLVLGNLWDVTDRDIDRYMQALLNNWLKAGSRAPLLQHIIESRQAPKLRYMIGAAPIAYGLPVFLK